MRTGGIPLRLLRRRRRDERPKLLLLCDLSESVRLASRYMLELVVAASELFDGELIIAHYGSGFYYSVSEAGALVWQGLRAGEEPVEGTGLLLFDALHGQGDRVGNLLIQFLRYRKEDDRAGGHEGIGPVDKGPVRLAAIGIGERLAHVLGYDQFLLLFQLLEDAGLLSRERMFDGDIPIASDEQDEQADFDDESQDHQGLQR